MISKSTINISDRFFSNLKSSDFLKLPKYSKGVTAGWLVRTGHLFNGISKWLKFKHNLNIGHLELMNAWALARDTNISYFDGISGRLYNKKGLSFLKALVPNIEQSHIDDCYSYISTLLKEWDLWYLDNLNNGILSAVAPISIEYNTFMTGNADFVFSSEASESFKRPTVATLPASFEVSVFKNNDEQYNSFAILDGSVNTVEVKTSGTEKTVGQIILNGPMTMDKAVAYANALDNGQTVKSNTLKDSPQSAKALEDMDQAERVDFIIDNVSRTPILDFVKARWEIVK